MFSLFRYENLSRVSGIHPSNLNAVNDARQRAGQQQNANQSDGSGSSSVTEDGTSTNESSPFLRGHRTRFGTMDGNCPVCLNQLHLPIETNCGHLFCGAYSWRTSFVITWLTCFKFLPSTGRCIVIYWQHAQWRGGAIRCPVCRQQVNILLPCFSTSSTNSNQGNTSFSATLSAATSDWINYFLSFLYSSSPTPSSVPSASSASTQTSLSTNSSNQQQQSLTNGASSLGFRSQPPPDDLLNNANNSTNQTSSTTTTLNDPNQERTNVIREIHNYNRRFSGAPRPVCTRVLLNFWTNSCFYFWINLSLLLPNLSSPKTQWSDYLYDLPTLLRHLTNDFFSFNGLMYMFRIRIVLCVVAAIMYLISPLDMIPEAVFGIFGLFDDIVILLLLAIYVTIIYRRFLSSRWEMEWSGVWFGGLWWGLPCSTTMSSPVTTTYAIQRLWIPK